MEDLTSQLPNDLLHKILLNLKTSESVRTSVLSTRWRHLWQSVPGLIFDGSERDLKDFLDRFLNRDKELSIQTFTLWCCDFDKPYWKWKLLINQVLIRGVQFLKINGLRKITLPVSFYRCETLVNLHLLLVKLKDFDGSEFINLPRLQVMDLDSVWIPSDVVLEMLILSSPVLQELRLHCIRVGHVNVRSLTLRSLSLRGIESKVVIDTPNLESLSIRTSPLENFRVENVSSSIKICIYDSFTDMQILRKFFAEISQVTDLSISGSTLHRMYKIYSAVPQHQLPEFKNLTRLYAYFFSDILKMLPLYLSTCPNLKSIDLELHGYLNMEEIANLPVPQCLQTSNENVNIKMTHLAGHKRYPKDDIKFAKYILENAKTLKKFNLWLDEEEDACSNVLEQILRFRDSTSVEVKIHRVASNFNSRLGYFFK